MGAGTLPGVESPEVRESARLSSGSSLHGRFVPGKVLAGRYRIVALLGQGGMGEVYRADDLRLGQPVALKFLSKLGRDGTRLNLFLNEVRLSRQVSHPNVCRVHDIGEVDGQHFLSMEYIDGEDLQALLRRIGRLPKDKGIQIAQQLCAGLAAAHDKGVLHRDLKPANIMIDGHGQVRITDFGLAAVTNAAAGEHGLAGTPPYMAPEQLGAGETSIQSDLYALGLVLFEVFTGERALRGNSPVQLLAEHEDGSVSQPSSFLENMDPEIERVILRCLEKQPEKRPPSARSVAAALPGGDLLASALAAGETPSPEMVAAAGETGGLSMGRGIALLAAVCLAVVALPVYASWLDVFQWSRYRENPPAILNRDASKWIERLGYDAPRAGHHASQLLSRGKDHRLEFIGRVSQRTIDPMIRRFFGPLFWRATRDNPSVLDPGMISVRIDPSKDFEDEGQLLEFLASPDPWQELPSQQADPDSPWSGFFASVGLDDEAFREIPANDLPPGLQPPTYVDRVSAWVPTASEESQPQIIMATRNGRKVYFRNLAGDAGEPSGLLWKPGDADFEANPLFLIIAFSFSAIMAIRNLRMGRADTKGGLRLVIYFFAIDIVLWAIALHPSFTSPGRTTLLIANYVILASARTLRVWLYYIAFEPYVRRLWPDVLISSSRLLAGRYRDPRVGRDLLVGCLFGIVVVIALQPVDSLPFLVDLDSTLDGSSMLARVLEGHQSGIKSGAYYMAILLLCRVLLRKTWLAAGLFAVAVCLEVTWRFRAIAEPMELIDLWILDFLWAAGTAALLIRFGMVAGVASVVTILALQFIPHTTDLGAWYANGCKFSLAAVTAAAVYGFYTSTLAHRESGAKVVAPSIR